ncbi:putative bifunctional diguanylate cyclase/phosphodiesterase [Roseibium aggregatum]|uniref:putative bifunctional diguanylate cyclase/phosphodiesterase n=1 Tax=Roseibium aggregatum TaxID=187304 RepID=UPI001A8EC402|nr:bifunctional diguanylate cyclase/phosphodiesterase [Roseibium aggregatum]MBN8179766.1 bifunctional diguanylate cyclase/phosphodiesterase [Roseibium aggregatum]UES46049.1 EAL domain-containing protein [Roseibium aggregatum]
MRIRGWLTGLIVFLLAPSLLFASLWFHNKFEKVNSIDHSLAGLHLIEALGPLMQEKALTGKIRETPVQLRERLETLGGDELSADLVQPLDTFLNEGNIPLALRQARILASMISQVTRLSSTSSFETAKLPHLITDTMPTVVIESAIMASNAKSISSRGEINVWDKMLIPVQGGQYKIAADGASRDTVDYFNDLTGEQADLLQKQARAFRTTNVAFQTAGSKLLSSTITASKGADVIAQPVVEMQPALVSAAFDLWQSTVDYLLMDLQRQRSETLFAVTLAGLVGGLVIVAAFAIAIALSRALADRTQQEFENLGFHDPLTGLPNRRALLNTIRNLPPAEPRTRTGAILIDLRQFKKVNDRFGDHNGDSLLRQVAEQLTQHAEPEDFLCRTGGTEFLFLRPRLKKAAQFEQLAFTLLQEIATDRIIGNNRSAIEANAGIFISSPGEQVFDHLLTDAALALRAAKQKGPRKFDRFTPAMRAAFEESDEIAKELQNALKNGNIVAWFQPQVNIHTGEVVGAEALARWIDDDEIRYPGSFLPAAMEVGYLEEIEEAVRSRALKFAASLSGKTRPAIHLGLNVTASLLTSAKAVDALHRQVLDLGLQPADVSLEILEAVMIDEITATPIKQNIARLSELGFFIELDDFGTGHSSISSLRDLKVDRVKIDRSFISGVDADPALQKFTSALINLAKSLDISVLAEGVETEAERDWLKRHGCDVIQGFLISKAVPDSDLAMMILKQNFTHPMTALERHGPLRSQA